MYNNDSDFLYNFKISFSVPPKYISFNGTLKFDANSEVYLTNNFNDSNSF